MNVEEELNSDNIVSLEDKIAITILNTVRDILFIENNDQQLSLIGVKLYISILELCKLNFIADEVKLKNEKYYGDPSEYLSDGTLSVKYNNKEYNKAAKKEGSEEKEQKDKKIEPSLFCSLLHALLSISNNIPERKIKLLNEQRPLDRIGYLIHIRNDVVHDVINPTERIRIVIYRFQKYYSDFASILEILFTKYNVYENPDEVIDWKKLLKDCTSKLKDSLPTDRYLSEITDDEE